MIISLPQRNNEENKSKKDLPSTKKAYQSQKQALDKYLKKSLTFYRAVLPLKVKDTLISNL